MSRCDLFLKNYRGHYTGGETIVGHVLVTLDKKKDVNAIIVKIKGVASTHWSESLLEHNLSTERPESHAVNRVNYSGSEVLIRHHIDLAHNAKIPRGVHKFPFKYILPPNLPSTFHGTRGSIVYKIKAVVERPFLKFNYEAESELAIYTPINLNHNLLLKAQCSNTERKKLYWNRGNLSMKIDVPFTGIAIGQPLPIRVTVNNLARVDVEAIKCTVTKTVKYTVTSPTIQTHEESIKIFQDRYTGVDAYGESTFDKTILISDKIAVSNFGTCGIIQGSYALKVELVLPFPHTNPTVMVPITLGNIPIDGSGLPVVREVGQTQPAACHHHVRVPSSNSIVEPSKQPQPPHILAVCPQPGGPHWPMPNESGTVPSKNDEAIGSHGNQGLPSYDEATSL